MLGDVHRIIEYDAECHRNSYAYIIRIICFEITYIFRVKGIIANWSINRIFELEF